MTQWGPTLDGFNRPRAADLLQEIKDDIVADLGPDAPVNDSTFEAFLGVFARQVALGWEALEKIYHDFDPDQAEGAALDNLLSLTGLSRLQPTKTVGEVKLEGNPGTHIPAGFKVKNDAADVFYETLEDAQIAPNGEVVVRIEALETGKITAEPDTIVTVIAGLSSDLEIIAFTPGRELEEDPDARIRREASLQVLGKGTVNGMTADLLALEFIEAAIVLENDTGTTQNGLAPYSVRPILYPEVQTDAEQQRIAEVLWSHKSGIHFDASAIAYQITSHGAEHTVRWDWAAEVPIYIEVDLTISQRDWPEDGEDQVKSAIQDTIDALKVGEDVQKLDIYCAINSVPGIVSADMRMGKSAGPGSDANISIAAGEVAVVDEEGNKGGISVSVI